MSSLPSLLAACRSKLAAAALLLLLCAGCTLQAAPPGSYPEGSGTLVVDVTGFRSGRGRALASLFAGAAGFPDAMGQGIRTLASPIAGERCRIVFSSVPWGEYALSVLHDENGDGRMQSSWFGIPKEGHGVSNNPESRFGPPRYEEARFVFMAAERTLHIRIHYLDDRGPGSRRPAGAAD